MDPPQLLGALLWLRNQYHNGTNNDANRKRTVLAIVDAMLMADETSIDYIGFREMWLPALKGAAYETLTKEDSRATQGSDPPALGRRRKHTIKGRNLDPKHRKRKGPPG